MDISAPASMKNAANCDKQCELQNSVSHQIFERTLALFLSMLAFSALIRLTHINVSV